MEKIQRNNQLAAADSRDTFVGIRKRGDHTEVNFPLGYRLDQSETGMREDLFLLINTLNKFQNRQRDGYEADDIGQNNDDPFPVSAYMSIMSDFLSYGYYTEKETHFSVKQQGKIDWKRTTQRIRGFVQGEEIYYLNYVVRNSDINQNELLTQIHEYFVYECFSLMGWLYGAFMPKKPRIQYDRGLFRAVLYEKLGRTYTDLNKRRITNMLDVLHFMEQEKNNQDFTLGTTRFEYVWEHMIDQVYGSRDKESFFPRTYWQLDAQKKENSALLPDTIMLYKQGYYILDAKYYKYGVTKIPSHLPDSSSISKQIVYGEHIYNNISIVPKPKQELQVYNAFLMPYNRDTSSDGENIKGIGAARSAWKKKGRSYEKVAGVLIDTKYLMQLYHNHSGKAKDEIARIITDFEKPRRTPRESG